MKVIYMARQHNLNLSREKCLLDKTRTSAPIVKSRFQLFLAFAILIILPYLK